jgi:hypothetical protein
MATYTAEQFWTLLDRLHDTGADLPIFKGWDGVKITRKQKTLNRLIATDTLTIEVDAGDGAGWFVVAVCRITTSSQDEFDGEFIAKVVYAFHQHDGDLGNAAPSLARWYHTMQIEDASLD